MTYRILDLFCGAGGAAKGYADAGFEVVGVDINPQPRYPFGFAWQNALDVLRGSDIMVYRGGTPDEILDLRDFDAIHASPPCQAYSAMSHCRPGLAEKYPKLIEPTRELLQATGLPYVIENVEGAPLRPDLRLCGTQFELGVRFNGRRYELQRHRIFETSWRPIPMDTCEHNYRAFPLYGHGAPGNRSDLRGMDFASAAREVMGIDWMNRDELAEAIPPVFTEFVGLLLRAHLDSSHREAA
jgi:DNA (cytosine-5)-methyltransferase 1